MRREFSACCSRSWIAARWTGSRSIGSVNLKGSAPGADDAGAGTFAGAGVGVGLGWAGVGGWAGATAGDFCGEVGCTFGRLVISGLRSGTDALVLARLVPVSKSSNKAIISRSVDLPFCGCGKPVIWTT